MKRGTLSDATINQSAGGVVLTVNVHRGSNGVLHGFDHCPELYISLGTPKLGRSDLLMRAAPGGGRVELCSTTPKPCDSAGRASLRPTQVIQVPTRAPAE